MNITPVMYLDPSGESFIGILATLVLGTVIGGISGFIAALINGDDLVAGFWSGFISGVIITTGVAIALTLPFIAGVVVSTFFGFVGGFTGDILNQGISNNWTKIDTNHALGVGFVTGLVTLFSFGISSYIYRSTPYLFKNVLDKTLSFTTRLNNSLSMNVHSFYLILTYGSIGSVSNSVLNLLVQNNDEINIEIKEKAIRGLTI